MVDGTEKAYGAETAVFIETVVFHGQDRPAEKIRDFLEIRRFPVLLVEGGNHLALVAQDPGGQGLLGRARRQAEKGQERPGQEKKKPPAEDAYPVPHLTAPGLWPPQDGRTRRPWRKPGNPDRERYCPSLPNCAGILR